MARSYDSVIIIVEGVEDCASLSSMRSYLRDTHNDDTASAKMATAPGDGWLRWYATRQTRRCYNMRFARASGTNSLFLII